MLGKRTSKSSSLYDDDDDDVTSPPPEKKTNSALYDGDDNSDDKLTAKAESANPTNSEVSEVVAVADVSTSHDAIEVLPIFSVLGVRKGEREDMQDAHLLIDGSALDPKDFLHQSALFAIFDGHAGAKAARFCEEHLRANIKRKLSTFSDLPTMEKSLKKVFTESFKEVDDAFLKEARKQKPVWKDGTTVTVMLLLNRAIYVANLGDSKAIACRYKPETKTSGAVQLTVDHNPIAYEERMRIQKAGGFVKDGRINGVIEVSRSIGDGQFKTCGVTCVPDMKKLTITENDRFLILACDGLWKSFTNEDAIAFVETWLAKPLPEVADEFPEDEATRKKNKWRRAVDELAAEAVRRRCGDNVSVILVRLREF